MPWEVIQILLLIAMLPGGVFVLFGLLMLPNVEGSYPPFWG